MQSNAKFSANNGRLKLLKYSKQTIKSYTKLKSRKADIKMYLYQVTCKAYFAVTK